MKKVSFYFFAIVLCLSFVGCSKDVSSTSADIKLYTPENSEEAVSPDEIVFEVLMGESVQYLNLFKNGENYYLFLPAAAQEIRFANVGKNTKVLIDEKEISSDRIRINDESWIIGENYFEFVKDDKSIAGNLCVCKAASVPAIFIETEQSFDDKSGNKYCSCAKLIAASGGNENIEFGDSFWVSGSSNKKSYHINTSDMKEWTLLAGSPNELDLCNLILSDFVDRNTDLQTIKAEPIDVYINGMYYGLYYLYKNKGVNANSIITTEFEEINAAILAKDGINIRTGKHYSEYIRLSDFVDKYLLDIMFTSEEVEENSLLFEDAAAMEDIMKSLITCEDFIRACEERYASCYKPYIKYSLPYEVYSEYEAIGSSVRMNNIRWGIQKEYESDTQIVDSIVGDYNNRLKSSTFFIASSKKKVTFLDENRGMLLETEVESGECVEEIPDIILSSGIFINWGREDTGEILSNKTPIFEDATYIPYYMDMELIILNGIAASGVEIDDMNPQKFIDLAENIRKKQNEN